MASITKLSTGVRLVSDAYSQYIQSHTCGEAIANGDTLSFDRGTTTGRVWKVDFTDEDRAQFYGIALDAGNAGGAIRVATMGAIVTGFNLVPSTTAIHASGNMVYTATDGGLADSASSHVLNAQPVGMSVSLSGQAGNYWGILIGAPNQTSLVHVKNNLSASSAPAVTNDVDEGYGVGSLWIDTTGDDIYMCADNSDGSAVWVTIGTTA